MILAHFFEVSFVDHAGSEGAFDRKSSVAVMSHHAAFLGDSVGSTEA